MRTISQKSNKPLERVAGELLVCVCEAGLGWLLPVRVKFSVYEIPVPGTPTVPLTPRLPIFTDAPLTPALKLKPVFPIFILTPGMILIDFLKRNPILFSHSPMRLQKCKLRRALGASACVKALPSRRFLFKSGGYWHSTNILLLTSAVWLAGIYARPSNDPTAAPSRPRSSRS